MKGIKIGSATTEILSDSSMAIAGGMYPRYFSEQEGKIRVSAIVIERNIKLCIISCDVCMVQRDILDEICRNIETDFGIPFENILIAATHTHHAPATATILGCSKNELFCRRMKDSTLSAVHAAISKLKKSNELEIYFWLGEESTVGQNSRLLMKDGTIYWVGSKEDALRPTGPFDPELPVMVFKQADGDIKALIFNHSTHNIGARQSNKRSPGFYGLAAQELEKELGGTVIFLPGAAGSTHNLTLSTDEMVLRIKSAIKKALSFSQYRAVSFMKSVKREIEYHIRKFDEEKEDKAISYYCNKRLSSSESNIEVFKEFARSPESVVKTFKEMRHKLLEYQDKVCKTWLQVIVLGDIALVGIPGEFFTELGIQIKRQSPFRYTYIIELANDYIGYIPDKQAFDLGGYQVWTGFHSLVAKGTGEAMVKKTVQLLSELYRKIKR